MERKPFDAMTDNEQNALMDEWISDARHKSVSVVLPEETMREGYYHVAPEPLA
ncbi:hypothetical protein [Paraburkholderia sp. GAS334]|uniref:hypothetical protein n=1 Tax=Paraburkholderia sp. GAS334 TaxID=3035131 RepID=UPI003D1BC74E